MRHAANVYPSADDVGDSVSSEPDQEEAAVLDERPDGTTSRRDLQDNGHVDERADSLHHSRVAHVDWPQRRLHFGRELPIVQGYYC